MMKTATSGYAVDRPRSRRWRGPEYWICTNVFGAIVELHATHLATGQRFVSRAQRWELAVTELDRMVNAYGPLDGNESNALTSWRQHRIGRIIRDASEAMMRQLRE